MIWYNTIQYNVIWKYREHPAVITTKWKEQEGDRESPRNNIQKFIDGSINPLLWKGRKYNLLCSCWCDEEDSWFILYTTCHQPNWKQNRINKFKKRSKQNKYNNLGNKSYLCVPTVVFPESINRNDHVPPCFLPFLYQGSVLTCTNYLLTYWTNIFTYNFVC